MVSNKDSFLDAAKLADEIGQGNSISKESIEIKQKTTAVKKSPVKRTSKKFASKKFPKKKKNYSKKMLDDVSAQPMVVEKTTTVTTVSNSTLEDKKEREVDLDDNLGEKLPAPFAGGLIEIFGGGLMVLIGVEILIILILFILWIF